MWLTKRDSQWRYLKIWPRHWNCLAKTSLSCEFHNPSLKKKDCDSQSDSPAWLTVVLPSIWLSFWNRFAKTSLSCEFDNPSLKKKDCDSQSDSPVWLTVVLPSIWLRHWNCLAKTSLYCEFELPSSKKKDCDSLVWLTSVTHSGVTFNLIASLKSPRENKLILWVWAS